MTDDKSQIRGAFPSVSPGEQYSHPSPDQVGFKAFSPAKFVICHLSYVISFEAKARMNFRYAQGEISDGLISERPPQKTLVYFTGIPHSFKWLSIAALCAKSHCLSVPWATAMMFTLPNSGPASRQ